MENTTEVKTATPAVFRKRRPPKKRIKPQIDTTAGDSAQNTDIPAPEANVIKPVQKTESETKSKKIPTPFELFHDEGISKTGWAGLTVPLFKDVEKWNKNETGHKFMFSQIKEKYGSLCLYNFGATPEQWTRIRMCEKASDHICMQCGSPFRVGKTQNGWITTLCESCAKEDGHISDDILFIFEDKKKENSGKKEIRAKSETDAFEKICEDVENEIMSKTTNTKTAETTYETYREIEHRKVMGWIKDNFKLVGKEKYNNWNIEYDSVRISPVIKMALKLQKIEMRFQKMWDKLSYRSWLIRGKAKFLFTHYILRSDKMDKTIFNTKRKKS
jgi:hypothetical protein